MDWPYWTEYWWMLPLAIPICATACAASVEGATMFTPLFALGFPLLGVSALPPGQAIATALLIETVGYSSGLLGHARQGTVVWSRTATLGAASVPAAAVGAALSHRLPGEYLLLGVAAVLFGLGLLVLRTARAEAVQSDRALPTHSVGDQALVVPASDGRAYRCPPDRRPGVTRALSAAAGGVTGLVGISIGEVTTTQLMLRLDWPARVAIGTGVGVVLPTVVTAGIVQAALLPHAGIGIPWNLLIWTVPAVLIGGQVGSHITGLVPERWLKRGVGVLFVGLALAVTVSTLRRLTS